MNRLSFILPAVLITGLWLSVPAHADSPGDVVQPERSSLNLTIFPQSGWVHESLSADLITGENKIIHYGVARQVDPGSVQLLLDGSVTQSRISAEIYGWDQTYTDLKGRDIRLISESGHLVEGELLDYKHGRLYIRNDNGTFTMIPNPYNYLLEMDQLPDMGEKGIGIEAIVEANQSGMQNLDLYYVMSDVSWNMDYSIVLNEDETLADITGIAAIRNFTGVPFNEANVRLVAGEPRISPKRLMEQHVQRHGAGADMMMARESADREPERYADYYVYEIPMKLDLAERDIHRIPLIDASSVTMKKIHRYIARPFSGSSEFRQPDIAYQFINDEEDGPGKPLPAGDVRVYGMSGLSGDSGRPGEGGSNGLQLIGQDRISSAATGDRVDITTGKSFDIRISESAAHRDQIGQRTREETREVTIRNEKEKEAIVTIEVPLHRNLTIREASAEPVRESADRAVYEITIPAKDDRTLTLTIRQEG